MTSIINATGSCLCGANNFTIESSSNNVGSCHCSMCRKWSGGPQLAIECVVKFESDEKYISIYESSDWAERGFCCKCGSHLFYRTKPHDVYLVPVGLLNYKGKLNFNRQLFIDEKPEFYSFSNDTENLTSQQVFDSFFSE
jgi:hypothetical protein